jgi:mannitol-1-phosphate 5-dehydrogenase
MDRSSTVFKGMLLEGLSPELAGALDARVGFADTMIARVVAKPKDPLRLVGEEYSEWTADRKALRGPDVPAIKTLDFVDEQARYLQRKLYIHNTGHATLGYLGFIKGYTYIHEAARDPAILDATAKAIEESGWAIQKEHGFSEDVIRAYRQALLDKVPCAELPDEITRVVREPLRKLGPSERFFGPVGLLLKHGCEPDHVLRGLCAALLADVPGDSESARLRQLLQEGGVRRVLQAVEVHLPDEVVRKIESLLPAVRQASRGIPRCARDGSEMRPAGQGDAPGRSR